MNDLPLVLVVGSGYHLYREYLLAGIARAANIWLLAPSEPSWERRYIVGSSVVDPFDTEALLAQGVELAAQQDVAGVISWDELLVLNAARLADRLGLPGPGVDAVARCRDKSRTRQALTGLGVPQPMSTPVSSLTDAAKVASGYGFPVVVKPLSLGASIGVSKVLHPDDLSAAYAHASGAFEDGNPPQATVLVEECVTGEEISVDCAVIGSVVTPLIVARKILGFGAACEEVGHTVDSSDPLLTVAAFGKYLQRVHDAVGYDTGITHVEVMLTANGPRLIEVNARLGGDLIPLVAAHASGIDAGRIAVDVALGIEPAQPDRGERTVARIDFLYPDEACKVGAIERHEPLPDGVVDVVTLAQPGQELGLPPECHVAGRYGYVISVATTSAAVAARAQRGREALVLTAATSIPA